MWEVRTWEITLQSHNDGTNQHGHGGHHSSALFCAGATCSTSSPSCPRQPLAPADTALAVEATLLPFLHLEARRLYPLLFAAPYTLYFFLLSKNLSLESKVFQQSYSIPLTCSQHCKTSLFRPSPEPRVLPTATPVYSTLSSYPAISPSTERIFPTPVLHLVSCSHAPHLHCTH